MTRTSPGRGGGGDRAAPRFLLGQIPVRLRPPAGAPPSPRPRRAHVTATERPRGRGRRGPGRAGRAGPRSGRGRSAPGAAPPPRPSARPAPRPPPGARGGRGGAGRGRRGPSRLLVPPPRKAGSAVRLAALQGESSAPGTEAVRTVFGGERWPARGEQPERCGPQRGGAVAEDRAAAPSAAAQGAGAGLGREHLLRDRLWILLLGAGGPG